MSEKSIQQLEDDAASVGDSEQVALCQLALDGVVRYQTMELLRGDECARVATFTKETARIECMRVIEESEE